MNMLNSAKKFAMKNKEKIAAGVDKATDAIDKKTHGKYHDKLDKVDSAASKFGGKPKEQAADGAAAAAGPATTAEEPNASEAASEAEANPEADAT